MDKVVLGKKIRQLREQKNLTQMQLAETVEMSDSALSNIEIGKVVPQLNTLIAIAATLNVSLDYLINDNNEFDKKVYIQEVTERISKMAEQDIKHILGYIEFYAESERKRIRENILDK